MKVIKNGKIEKMNVNKHKTMTLASGYVDGNLWRIRFIIKDDESILFPTIETRNQIESSHKYYHKNKKEILRRQKEKFDNDLELQENRKKHAKEYRITHPDKDKIYRKNNPDKHKIWDARHQSKRKGLGFTLLNTPLDDMPCEAHHINEEEVIYIPTIIHRRVKHNLKTGKNMELINSIAEGFK